MGYPLIDSDPRGRIFREVQRLHDEGFSIIPLGGGDGKKPLVRFRDQRPLPMDVTVERIKSGDASGYGIRLTGLCVLDVDSTDAEVPRQLEERFGQTAVKTRTPSGGMHLFYRADSHQPLNLRAEGLKVDVKQGENQYVVGAHSVRPDGARYAQLGAPLSWATVPPLALAYQQPTSPSPVPAALGGTAGQVPKGNRNFHLIEVGMSVVEKVRAKEELLQLLRRERDTNCADPASFPDRDVEKVADWCWRCRLENRVYKGRSSEFRVSRPALDRLQGKSAAEHLYIRLQDKHGHQHGKTFPLDHRAMVAAKLTDLSRERFNKAIDSLKSAGLLEVAGNHVAGVRKRQYRLLLPSNIRLDTKP